MITLRISDNLVHIHPYERGRALVVDPPTARPIEKALAAHDLTLTTILVTHHHGDHVAGVRDLKDRTGCTVYGPEARIPGLDNPVADGDQLTLGPTRLEVMATPGHTRTSLCYYCPSGDQPLVFTGDTLFIGGCGRLFEGSPRDLWQSLQRLAQLPDETVVCCGHDYTEENCRFALTIEPDNARVRQLLRSMGPESPLYSTIAQEKQTNVFMRAASIEEFARRRKLKDRF